MTRVTFRAQHWAEVQGGLFGERAETCAAFLSHRGTLGRVVVFEGGTVPDSAYLTRTPVAAVLHPGFLVELGNRAKSAGCGVLLAHTHPCADGVPDFSETDDAGERALGAYLLARLPGLPLLTMVIGPDGARAREVAGGEAAEVWYAGESLLQIAGSAGGAAAVDGRFDRQVRAFGAQGQRAVSALTVCVVGAGGTGSVLVQQLALLGVRSFVLIDPDNVEATNLNRIVGCRAGDVGRPKVDVARDVIVQADPQAHVRVERRNVLDADVLALVSGSDFVFCCTDSHASRAVVCQVAYQYHVPVIDTGVAIGASGGSVSHVTGRVQMLSPGLPCLLCTGALDSEKIRLEMMDAGQRAADPYFEGEGEPQPAVVSLNSTISSLAVTMFLSAVAGIPAKARHQSYDAISGAVRPVAATARAGCPICSARGALSRGDSWPLPARQRL